ncbi:flagellar biosynthesis protein FlgA [Palleronia sp. LCG004]|uniref:NAD(P)H-dependent oxidoreductase n=1 Tax=Palleronia sp. LCG004 TaxID=3079304 RepID=UPI0029427A32|nr:flagellar biosynthesis protein FlgA [Palleronia sp. LCG004]WOI58320.1 flagellar biosynthesis protein FlgA [Palleronia sp. LCG004]
MNHHAYFDRGSRSVDCTIIGTGGFGRSFLAQGQVVPGLSVRVAVDRESGIAAESLRSVGVAASEIRECSTADEAQDAWNDGAFIAASDYATVAALPVKVVVEATGAPESGARHARMALENGCHVAMVSKEVDSVVGPGLAAMARERNLIVSPVDGDQPSLLIGLITWAEVLGLEIVAAGKSSEYDFVHDRANGTMTVDGETVEAPDFAGLERLGDGDCAEFVARRAAATAMLPQRAVPDLCEMTLVANACGMLPDRPDLHCPIARIDEVATILSETSEGGILSRPRVLDVFHCLREPGEVSFAGGVFVVVRCKHDETWEMLRGKGHAVSRSGRTAMIYIPRHLLGMEAATTIFEIGLKGVSSGAEQPGHHIDLVAHADRDFPAGSYLEMGGHHHSIEGVSSRMMPGRPLDAQAPAPFYIASNCRLARDVRAGELIRMGDLVLDRNSELVRLREEQDRRLAEQRLSA